MADLSLNNVYDVSVSAPGAGVGEFNTSNLAVFTHEPFDPATFGDDGYKLFVDPGTIAKDFGSAALTTRLINTIFGQVPNIRANSGYAVVIPVVAQVQTITYSAAPASGTYVLTIGGVPSPAINWNDTAAQIQTKIRTMGPNFANAVVSNDGVNSFSIEFVGKAGGFALLTVGANSMQTGGAVAVTVAPAILVAAETIAEAITRAESLVAFFGAIFDVELTDAEMQASATVLLPMRKIGFFLGHAEADLSPAGKLDKLRSGGFNNSRGLGYLDGSVADGLAYVAAYAARGLSTNFSGSNTTQTMHLKDLKSVQPDGLMTQTILDKAQASGVDVYASFRGVPKTYTSGANLFFDRIYNRLWFIEALQVASFNTIARASTKIVQTEGGVDVLKGSWRRVCEQAVTNAFSAPGEWTSPTTFGDQADFFDNVRQRGYFIYTQPISQQSVADREARKAPLGQIALKEAGAIHSGSIIINLNE